MDNAIDALKIAFAVLVFVLALSISMQVFGQAKAVSDEVFYMTDQTNFYEYTSGNTRPEGRIVSTETIIPTLYRYYKENFNVIIWIDGNKNNIFDETDTILWEFNLEKEIKKYQQNPTSAPWVGNPNIDTKKRVDIEIADLRDQKINGHSWSSQTEGGINKYNGKRFLETFKEIRYSGTEITIDTDEVLKEVGEGENQTLNTENGTLELVKGNKKIEILYQLLDVEDDEI